MEGSKPRASVRLIVGRGGLVLVAALLLIGWLVETPPGLLGKEDAVGYAVCHRIDARSFHMGNTQMPLCPAPFLPCYRNAGR